jgi:hypothetical protein
MDFETWVLSAALPSGWVLNTGISGVNVEDHHGHPAFTAMLDRCYVDSKRHLSDIVNLCEAYTRETSRSVHRISVWDHKPC